MNAAKPPIYRSKSKTTGKPSGDAKSTLRRNLSIPNVDKLKIDLGVPNIVLERSTSLCHLNDIKEANLSTKSLSASNILALSDPNLSLQEAKPKRFYDSPSDESAKEKAQYTAFSQMYFYQLTQGCENKDCKNKFCLSNKNNVISRFNNAEHMAIVFSTELAKSKGKFLCNGCNKKGRMFPQSMTHRDPFAELPLGCLLLTTTPFRSLFQPCPLVSSVFSEEIKVHQRSVSHGKLEIDSKSEKTQTDSIFTGISTMTSNMSSSISLLWKSPGDSEIRENQNIHGKTDREPSKHDQVDCPVIFGENTYIANNEDLEEFECAVASEMTNTNTNNIQGLSLTHLTLEMVEHIFQDYQECGDPSFILNTVRTVFSSSEALNASFLCENPAISGLSNSQIDRPSLEKAYRVIKGSGDHDFMSAIVDSITLLLSGLASETAETEGANQFVIIMEFPLFFDLNLPYLVADVFNKLPAIVRMELVEALSYFEADGLQRLLQGFQAFLNTYIKDKIMADKHILSLCNVIEMLYEANSMQNSATKILNDKEFYNKKLSRCLDVKKEYEHWQNIIHSSENARHGFSQASFMPNLDVSSSILQYPFLLQPETKVQIIHYEAINEMRKEYQAAIVHQAKIQTIERVALGATDSTSYSKDVWSAMCPYLVLEIRRDYLVDDALQQLQNKFADLKKPLKIKYTGGGEQGLDMGGLQKEFFQLAMERLFDPAYDMFVSCGETKNVWFNAKSCEPDCIFELTGMIIGLAIYNGIILDVPFPDVMYAKLKGEKPTLKHLFGIEPTLASSLKDLLDYDGDVEGELCLDFQIAETYLGSMESVDLLPGAKNITVTNKNRQLYVDLYVNHLLNERIRKQFDAFSAGFLKVCDGDAINLFRSDELELLICGSPQINFTELENVVTYSDGYAENDMTIRRFWSVVNNFTHDQKKGLLSFVTGSDRVPLTGLSSISFIIQRNGPDTENLPTSMTCFNRLLLPEYSSSRKLKEKLLIAIENGKGFGLT